MKKHLLVFFILGNIILFSSCKNKTDRALEGKWYAAKLLECDDDIPIQNNLINLEFRSNRTYTFNSTLNIHEEGIYKIDDNYLILQDKIKANSKTRTLLIKSLDTDSLVIQMNNKGLDQYLTLVRDFKKATQPLADTLKYETEVRVDTSEAKVSVSH